jgi:glutaredoxin
MILRAFLPVLALAAALFASAGSLAQEAPVPYAIARVLPDFPVMLYSSPTCKDPCEQARTLLNGRGIPFTEFQVWNEETIAKLKSVSGAGQVPVITVGREVLVGFEPGQLNGALTVAGYPEAGLVPPRKQAAPPLPEGYDGPAAAKATAEKKPAAAAPKPGPYDTSGLVGPAPKPGPYDPSNLQGPAPKPGPYGVPADSK